MCKRNSTRFKKKKKAKNKSTGCVKESSPDKNEGRTGCVRETAHIKMKSAMDV